MGHASGNYPSAWNSLVTLLADLRIPTLSYPCPLGPQKFESIAIKYGAALLRLETGVKQFEALALYRSAGFVEVESSGGCMIAGRVGERWLGASRYEAPSASYPTRPLNIITGF